jgi:ion channel-forming bestrophin family protein
MLLKKRIPFKFLISQVKFELIFVTLYSVILGVAHRYFGLETTIPMAVPSILGGAISLVIAFRLKQSYDRWWEARKIWGAIVNDSRTLIRNVITFTHLKQETLKDSKEDNIFVERQVAWCYSLSQGLRGINPLKGIREILKTDPDDYEYIKHHYNVPNALLMLHNYDFKKLHDEKKINDFQQVQLSEVTSRLCDHMGKCERIKNTVFPKTYSVFVEYLLYLFIILLPFGVMDFSAWFQIPLTICVSMAFFLLERTAIQMQDPFENKPTDTPMTTLSQTIELNLHQMIEEDMDEKPPVNKEFYQM